MKKESIQLFTSRDGEAITYADVVRALCDVGADDCDILMLHTELSFGLPNLNLGRKKLLGLLFDAFKELNVNTLLVPTFTFSFSNRKVYDVNNSKTTMGALNEFIRQQDGVSRSIDPQMSFAVFGKNQELIQNIGKDCLGNNSTFDKFHKAANGKILFFGANMEECCTYQHYVEKVIEVPYRYDKVFKGEIVGYDGETFTDSYKLFVKYRDIVLQTPEGFTERLITNEMLKTKKIGDGMISCISEQDLYNETKKLIQEDVNAFLGEAYDLKPLVKRYSYGNVKTVQ